MSKDLEVILHPNQTLGVKQERKKRGVKPHEIKTCEKQTFCVILACARECRF